MTRSVALAHLVRLEDGLSEGIWAGHTLRSAFQPIYGVQDERLEIVAYEGLLRAFRGEEPIPPMAFFTSIPALDRLHVETLTRTLHLLNAAVSLEDTASIFVNFNPSVFTEPGIADIALRDMRLVLHEAGIDAGRVVCEVTEQQSASEEVLSAFVEALRGNGFRIAVDDYGAADSDIARVAALKPDIVKFDAHWMNRLMDSDPGFLLLQTMVRAFEDRGIRTVFEGIEEAWQIDMAVEAGASMLQGYALARPELAVLRQGETKTNFHFLRSVSPHPAPPIPQVVRHSQKSVRSFGKRAAQQ
ncbi:MAG: EAL domain-containing protein [Hyphomicrobiales bacterium]|jgi:EAL domain-containing protein (putative c-di-GMP-specific phosphodiesterase class I)|nr:EAL domain-containing protein [Hyphomicrobiales bacterium]MCO5080039.1 EAL domain-containing protein [Rhizobiaceae bacterium]